MSAEAAAWHYDPDAPPPTGIWSWITTVDHKRIGILYGVSALVFFLIGGLEALIIRSQLAVPDGSVVSLATYNQRTMTGHHGLLAAGAAAFFSYYSAVIEARSRLSRLNRSRTGPSLRVA